jgi:hypothetical protein
LKSVKDGAKEKQCNHLLMTKLEEESKKPFLIDENQYENELHSLVKSLNDFGGHENKKLYFIPECC